MKTDNGAVLISVKHVRKTFKAIDGTLVNAIQDLSLEVKAGEFITILGPTGCGKSTLLNIVAGLEDLTDGEIFFKGKRIFGTNPEITMVFQDYALFPWKTVRDNIEFGLKARGFTKEEREQVSSKLLEIVGLDRFADKMPRELSGGMKQRVGIARALAVKPEVLLMDEPFGALDAQTRRLLQFQLLKIWEMEKKTVLFVTHSIEEAIFLADRVIVMTSRPGKIKEIMNVPFAHPRTEDVLSMPKFIEMKNYFWNVLKSEAQSALEARN